MALASARLPHRLVSAHLARTTTYAGILRLHTEAGTLQESYQSNFESKYAEKLKQRAQEKGLSVTELKARAKEAPAEQRNKSVSQASTTPAAGTQFPSSAKTDPTFGGSIRRDSSPVKPLSSILNIPRLFSTPHTAAQISTLWTAYHASLSGGTGKGYICASVPLDLYQKMITVSVKYPVFVVPVSKVKNDSKEEGVLERGYEFFFLQWDFHGAPPAPSAVEDSFLPSPTTSTNTPISTILFTPLQEYKMRASFATPYLVLTFYTNLDSSHGTILMRGEITPATAGALPDASTFEGRHLLTQEEAQLLAVQLQKFYLWGGGNNEGREGERERLLKLFHEKSEEFCWEDLLKYADLPL